MADINGTPFNDSLSGTPQSDRITGFEGNDFIRGEAGDDLIRGGTGNDTLGGQSGSDRIFGDAGNDSLSGGFGTGNNFLSGGTGNDILSAGGGNDAMSGGAGSDIFQYTFPFGGIGSIIDFSSADDTIQVDRFSFNNAGLQPGTITTAQFRLGSVAQATSDRFIYNQDLGELYFDRDGTGSAAQIKFTELSGSPFLTNTDIVVI